MFIHNQIKTNKAPYSMETTPTLTPEQAPETTAHNNPFAKFIGKFMHHTEAAPVTPVEQTEVPVVSEAITTSSTDVLISEAVTPQLETVEPVQAIEAAPVFNEAPVVTSVEDLPSASAEVVYTSELPAVAEQQSETFTMPALPPVEKAPAAPTSETEQPQSIETPTTPVFEAPVTTPIVDETKTPQAF